MFTVFVRNWYRRDPNKRGGLIPAYNARKTTIGHVTTEEAARDMCRVYNANNPPGRLSRKAEYRRD